MRVLAFDTAMTRCSVALAEDGRLLAYFCEEMSRGHAEALLPMVAMACEAGGVDITRVERVALTVGPGSFTGARVGVAAARGLALATGCALVAVTCLEAVAAGYYAQGGVGECVVLQDARRGEVYWQRFGAPQAQGWPQALDDIALLPVTQALDRLQTCRDRVIGTAAALMEMTEEYRLPDHDPLPDARILASLARAAKACDHDALQPLYIRSPDAKLPSAGPLARLAALHR